LSETVDHKRPFAYTAAPVQSAWREETVSGNPQFGSHVRALREAKRRVDRDFTLRRFAQAMGVSPTYLSRIERGEVSPPPAGRIRRIAELLDVDPDDLLRRAGKLAPDIEAFVRAQPAVSRFLRVAQERRVTPDELVGFTRELLAREPR
jgi:transcriptional regulator with XRE-family HTH domain